MAVAANKKKKMNIERFHNELAMRLGYERILENAITIEATVDPIVTLSGQGYDNISFRVSDDPKVMDTQMSLELKEIIDDVHQAYIKTVNSRF